MKAGIRRLHEIMVAETQVNVTTLPTRASGSALLLSASFMGRLLKGELELKVCPASDVSNAQPDLKHLSAEQLLAIRAPTLDFNSVSANFSAHHNFLSMLDSHLLEKLGRRHLRGSNAVKVAGYRFAGQKLVLVTGGVQVLRDGWDNNSPTASASRGDVPDCWAMELEHEEWPETPAIIVHTKELWVEAVHALPDELHEKMLQGAQLVVVSDASAVAGNDRVLHWDLAILPADRDLVSELRRVDRPRQSQVMQRKLTHELSKVLEERNKQSPEKGHLPQSEAPLKEKESPPKIVMPAANHEVHRGGMYSGVLASARERQKKQSLQTPSESTCQDSAPARQGDMKEEVPSTPLTVSAEAVAEKGVEVQLDDMSNLVSAETARVEETEKGLSDDTRNVVEAGVGSVVAEIGGQASSDGTCAFVEAFAEAEFQAQDGDPAAEGKVEAPAGPPDDKSSVVEASQISDAAEIVPEVIEQAEGVPAKEAEELATIAPEDPAEEVKGEDSSTADLQASPLALIEDQLDANKDDTGDSSINQRRPSWKARVTKDTSCFAWFGKVS